MHPLPSVRSDDALGVLATAVESPPAGEVELLNSKYTTTRFGFTYSWWSAYGWDGHLTGKGGKGDASQQDLDAAKSMKLINQAAMYKMCGENIEKDLSTVTRLFFSRTASPVQVKRFRYSASTLSTRPAWFKPRRSTIFGECFPPCVQRVQKRQMAGKLQ